MQIKLGNWQQMQADAKAIRYDVFIVEQNIPVELEWDDMDAQCIHAIAYDDAGNAVGTGRLLPDAHIGRMAVRRAGRGAGVGGLLLQALVRAAQARGDRGVRLNAQSQAAPFYLRHGFAPEGEEFEEAGIPHRCMRRDFP